jgi:hypothetical protein
MLLSALAAAAWLGACGSPEPTEVSADKPPEAQHELPRCKGEFQVIQGELPENIAPGGPQTPEEAVDAHARWVYTDLTGASFKKTAQTGDSAEFSFDDPEAGEIILSVERQGGAWHVTGSKMCNAAHVKRAKR